jgi:glycerol uptake facilitator-like aquaporin
MTLFLRAMMRCDVMIRKLAAEFIGTAMLLISVIGSGIMGTQLAQGNDAITLLANAIATGCMLYIIITVLGPISGAHFNPAVSLAFLLRRELSGSAFAGFVAAQITGAFIGVWAAHVMFDLPVFQISQTAHRTGSAQWLSEGLATLGLLFVIFGGLRARPDAVPTLVALYITGAYWFTSSTSFANPAVTLARGFSDTFAGINPSHITMFVCAQLGATLIGHVALSRLLDE